MMRLLLSMLILTLPVWPTGAAELTVFAASSLREPFTEIGQLYQQQTGLGIRFNFAGSQTLRTQIELGAPADLFAAADPEIIRPLVEKNLVDTPSFFAGNQLALLLSKSASPIRQIDDLTRDGIQIALGNQGVPIGKYTRQMLSGMADDGRYGADLVSGIWNNVRTQESSVKAIVARVLLDEVDAGIVYRSDLTTAVRAKTSHLALPEQHSPFVRYPAAVIRTSRRQQAARDFIDLLLAPAGQRILQSYDFLPPESGGHDDGS